MSVWGDRRGEIRLNEIGQVVTEEWLRSAEIRPEIELDEWIIMPNHLHGVVVIISKPITEDRPKGDPRVAPTPGPRPRSLASIIARFKGVSGKRINLLRSTPGMHVWQRNYYEHIIRNEKELERIREYITNNPTRWDEDEENPARQGL